jgi:hypothetical protein
MMEMSIIRHKKKVGTGSHLSQNCQLNYQKSIKIIGEVKYKDKIYFDGAHQTLTSRVDQPSS